MSEKEPETPSQAEDLLEELVARCIRTLEQDGASGVEQIYHDNPEHADRLRERMSWLSAQGLVQLDGGHESPALHQLGPFRILSVLGEGGMGTVYLAEQTQPVRRQVALKVIKLGMDSAQVLRRFEAERQALAMMEHSAIAKVFDAGTTERGQPYFVMEYVNGIPITEHCDQHHSSIEERIKLFRQVCSGVQHAHQKGVMHRDLKPSNVLIAIQEGEAVPKIIDFGLARATDQTAVQASFFTELGLILGTPEYMSPEQADRGAQDVDTRTDVYSLGVLLYELLVGELPFSSTDLRDAGRIEMERKIKEDEPPKPSTNLSTQDDAPGHAARRRTDTRSLLRRLRADLDWVVMKAIEKDRRRRYATPDALSDDLLRYLNHEPVVAGPPSAAYRVRKLIRRYRGQFAAAALVLVTLVGGIVSFAIANARANRNAKIAEENETAAIAALEAEADARQAAEDALQNIELMGDVVRLRDAQAAEPTSPDDADALRSWIAEQTAPLEQLRRALQELRAKAEPPTEQELATWLADHPSGAELTALRGKHAALHKAQEVRAGRAAPEDAVLGSDVPADAFGLNERAWPLVTWEEATRQWGREAEGLALARRAWQRAQGEPARNQATVADTLAWALFANGLDDQAVAMSEQALAIVPDPQKPEFESDLARLHSSIAALQDEGGADALAALAAEIEALETELSAGVPRQQWRFAEQADQLRHDTLTTLAKDVESYESSLGRAREHLEWAARVRELSITAHATQWERARQAVLRADGAEASTLYASEPPLDLRPQLGLVPIGMNPNTGLWEFYHLRSAADPSVIPPEHDENGNIEVTADTGIVFALIPGGTVMLGSQRSDPDGPNYDPQARPNEGLHEFTVAPFFLARHELTKGQWVRLSGGEDPSNYKVGLVGQGIRVPVSLSHPVEQVSWVMCESVLTGSGLQLPFEAQWEYACRAMADPATPWSTGATPASLAGYANLLDRTAGAAVPAWGRPEALDDGFIIHAPVGSFLPNAFGLHDMHGNVWEWCQDLDSNSMYRLSRGGGLSSRAVDVRSANRNNLNPAFQQSTVGVRAARAIR